MGVNNRILYVIKNNNIIRIAVVISLVFLSLIIGKLLFKYCYPHEYVFSWTTDKEYWYFPIVVCSFVVLGNNGIGVGFAVGNILGLFIGNYLGNFLRKISMAKITPDMEPELVHYYSYNHGWLIYWNVLFLTILVFRILELVIRKYECKTTLILNSMNY